ncbi:Alpha-L-fucosidase [Crateriforma conspicua]|uniref:alpha-L-fucosidase n=1 Tax=Crateriforma conspicua TaxID=2527996 RepID=A0A5C6FLG8_9PLAN|nr:alpha-L-fucosidase [Crateriforma conspicua]TWU62990.1 Alpha-L-fucosidase [Crateriforma conspicua]
MNKTLFGAAVLLGTLASPVWGQDATTHPELAPHPAVAPAVEKIDQVAKDGPFHPEWDSLSTYKIPQWYKDAKFGIFIHWGAYSVPAFGSEWYPRQMYIDTKRRGDNFFEHHRETYGPQKTFGYKDFIPEFKAEKFDAAAWAKLFKDTGARYVIPVAEHHDGFPMYDCAFTKWDASEMGPHRDVIAELADAVRAEGLHFGLSSHRAFNWQYYVRSEDYDNANPEFAGLYGRPMPFLFKPGADKYQENFEPHDDQFKDDWLARTCELVDKYQPEVMWFDFGIAPRVIESYDSNPFADHLKRFAAYYYNKTSGDDDSLGIINYKFQAFPESAAVLDKERSKMAGIREPFWQTDTAVSASSWGYTQNQKYKTPDRLVDDLVDIVSKNGCLLLNVGPRPDGTIPEEDQAILKAIGGWLKINGESIYGTEFWSTFGEGPTTVSTGHVSESKDKPFTAEDVRFTKKGDVIYATIMDWPESGQINIRTLAAGSEHWPGQIESIELLGSESPLEYDRTQEGLKITLPEKRPCDYAYVFKLR